MDTRNRWAGVLLVALLCGTATAQQRDRGPANQPAARSEVDAIRERLAALEERIAALESKIDALTNRLGAPAEAGPADAAAIRQAVRDKKFVPGMTFADISQVAGKPTELMETGEGFDVYRWTLSSNLQVLPNSPKPTELGEYTVIVQFRNGKATSFRRIEHGQRIPRDELRPRR